MIHEINPDKLTENKVSVNDAGLDDKKEYTVSEEAGEGTWHKYAYSIEKSVFKGEGEYNIIVYSKDKAENKAYSDMKDLSVKFVVDRTAPIVSVSGITKDGRYRTDKKTVKVIPSDDGGQLKKLTVKVFNSKGNETTPIKLEGKELIKAAEAGNISFELGQGLGQDVRIICEDVAGNITGEDKSGDLYENISVSTSAFLIFWANKVARYAAIAGVSVLAIGAVAFVVFRKKKNS